VIHPTAIIDPSAKLADDVVVGPWSVIGADVTIGQGTSIGSHVVIGDCVHMGERNQIYPFASIGQTAQHLAYNNELTSLEIGNANIIREYTTINRGTFVSNQSGVTRVGNHNFLMTYVHIAHDCIVGDHVIFVNNASIAGHVTVGDYATLGVFVGVHQFCQIGAYSFICRAAIVVKDVLPYMVVSSNPVGIYGLNKVGLRRQGYTSTEISFLQRAYHIISKKHHTIKEVILALKAMITSEREGEIIQALIDAFSTSKRGVLR